MIDFTSISKNKIAVFFVISLLFKPIWLFNNQDLGKPGVDDLSHWLHAATVAYDFDIDYKNDYFVDESTFSKETNIPYHPPGAGYLSSPFVFLFSLFDNSFVERLNPIGSFAYLGFFCASLFYCWFGLFLLFKIFESKNIDKNYFVIFSVLVGTLTHFVTTRFVMSHAVEFFLCSWLCYLFETTNKTYKISNLTNIGLVYFLLSFTRPSTFIYSLCLLIIYLKKKDINFKNFLNLLFVSLSYLVIHIFVSLNLYKKYTIFQHYQGNLEELNYVEFTFLHILTNTPKILNLIFSTSMGMIWTLPVVIFGIFSAALITFKGKNDNFLNSVFTFLYIYGAIVVLIVWQGREVTFGQRLLIGLIPFCAIKIIYILQNRVIDKLFKLFTTISYLGYLYFYSSDNLNLKRGLTLWGREVGYAGQDYFYYFFKEFYLIENIISLLGRTIYSVNLFSFVNFNQFSSILKLNTLISPSKLDKSLELTKTYFNIELPYLITVNVLIIIFCWFTASIIIRNKKNN